MFPVLQVSPTRLSLFLKYLLVGVVLLATVANVPVSDLVIKGKVVDEKAQPVSFATLMLKDKPVFVQTKPDGSFSLAAKSLPATIVCSAVGFETVERTIYHRDLKGSVATVLIPLKASTVKLKEVIVGYAAPVKSSRASPSRSYPLEGDASRLTSSAFPEAAAARTEKKISFPRKEGATKKSEASGAVLKAKTATTVKRTSLLTAGEVNDFRKWRMWEDYNTAEFRAHADKWNLYATRRYCVQLQSKDHKALAGYRLYLVNKKNGDTTWAAVSDNTGKAELWNGFSGKQTDNDLVIAVENEERLFSAIPFAQGVNKIVLNRNCKASNKVEIAFVVDATGSMQDEIEYLKEELGDILTKVAHKDPSLDLRTGAVFYRDKGDVYLTSVQPMAAGITNTLAYIKTQYADGGGDFPEALKEALQDATGKLRWSTDARTRIIFLLMDAPPHDETKAEMATLIRYAAAKGIRIVPVACSGTDKATEFIMRSMALATNGTYLFLTDDSGIGNPHIKPTTDEFKVELLNDLMQRTIEQMCFVNDCYVNKKNAETFTLYSNIENVKLFPNPTTGPVVLETWKELTEIFVTDFTGKILLRKVVNQKSGKYSLDLSGFPSATYYIRYTTKENKTGAEKLVLAR